MLLLSIHKNKIGITSLPTHAPNRKVVDEFVIPFIREEAILFRLTELARRTIKQEDNTTTQTTLVNVDNRQYDLGELSS